MFVTQS